LSEAFWIAESGEMILYQVDCQLEYARLYLAEGAEKEAHKALEWAADKVQELGYHRRDREVASLKKFITKFDAKRTQELL